MSIAESELSFTADSGWMVDGTTDREQLSRKDRERERHRKEILKAAERVFALKGYQGATVEEIAKEAEFAVGTIYKFFKGKEELYIQAAESLFQEFMRQFEQTVLSIADPEEALGALIELRLTYSEAHRRFLRVFFETLRGNRVDPVHVIPAHLARVHDEYMESIRRLFERGVADGTFDEADPLYLTLCLEGIINAFVAYWSRHDTVESLAVRIAKLQREFLGRIKLRLDVGPP
jgi:TetR/AcrR family transcriptional regulator